MAQSVEALVCVKPGELRVEHRTAEPRAEGFALVRPCRVGICGTDYHIYEGKHPFLQYPRIMGHELAVEVVEAPAGAAVRAGQVCVVNPYVACGTCRACQRGKPNCCERLSVLGVHQDGGMTGLMCLPAGNLVAAEGLSPDACATVEFLSIGAHAVRRGAVTGSDRVLVVGAGPIGLGVALFARLSGGDVTLFDRDAERAAVVSSIAGVARLEGPDLARSVREATGGSGFDVVFDATGSRSAIETGFDHVGHGGRYVLVSVVRDPVTFSDPDFHRKEMTLLGSRNATSEDFERVISAIRAQEVCAQRLITHRTSLARAVHDLPCWAADKTGLIKAVIEI